MLYETNQKQAIPIIYKASYELPDDGVHFHRLIDTCFYASYDSPDDTGGS